MLGDRTVSVALAGAGMISQYHLRAWQRLPNVEVAALVEPDALRAADKAKRFGIPRYYPSLEALLEAQRVDVLDIASPRDTHGPLMEAAVAQGMAVICQKPFMPTLALASDFVRRLPAGARVMVNQNFRFRPYFQVITGWMREGRLGRLSSLHISCRSSGLLPSDDGTYPYIERQPFVRSEKRLMIEEVLIHRIDIARWLAGELSLVAATARHSNPELTGESEAALLFRTREEGVPVTVDGNLASAGYEPAPAQDRVEVIGSRGRVMMDHDVLRLEGKSPEEIRYSHAQVYQESFDATMAHFVDCLRTGAPFLTGPEDNLATLELVEEAYRFLGLQADIPSTHQ